MNDEFIITAFIVARSGVSMSTSGSQKPWGGRFRKATDARTEAFTQSISFDRVLFAHDIAGSMAHATMLAQCGLISESERDQIIRGLGEILKEIEQGKFVFKQELEDIHMNVERALEEKIGEAAGKLHT